MKYNPDIHHRRSIRLKGYDYSQPGIFFVTLCINNCECILGEIENCTMILNKNGKLINQSWKWLSEQYEYVELDEFIIMPNHLHGLIIIINESNDLNSKGGSRTAPTKSPYKSLGGLLGAFKTVSTKKINLLNRTPKKLIWQRNYYERVVRNEKELDQIRNYILEIPLKWEEDQYSLIYEEHEKIVKP